MGKGTKFIMSQGEITRKDNSISFRRNGKNVYMPIEAIREIYFLNEVSLNTKFLDFVAKAGVVIHFFNYYGYYSGTFYPKEYLISGKMTIKQSEAFINNRIEIAKAFVKGIASNIYEVVYHYYKHDKKETKVFLDWIKKDFIDLMDKTNDIKQILFLEGQVWMRFYDNFKYFLPENFLMNKRVKRPPDNPMNAMVSFGNSILYARTISQIYHTHLNQSISFLHEPSEGRFSLSLDLSEVFKPAIVFRTIFDLVNNKRIQVSKHFDKKLNYCLLNEAGKKIFIEALETRFNNTFEHKKLKRKISYETAIKLDGYKLIKHLVEKNEFTPFSLKEMM
jgi:CRISPR-associated protein Cas1